MNNAVLPLAQKHRVVLASLVDILSIFVLFFLGQIVVSAGLAAWGITDFTQLAGKQTALMVSYIAGGLAMAAGLFGLMHLRRIPRSVLHLKSPHPSDVGFSILGYLLYIVVLVVTLTFVSKFIPVINLSEKQELGLLPDSAGITLIPIYVALVITPAFTEELLFRGFLYNRLRSRKIRFVVSAVVTSGLFALMHGQANVAIDTFILSMAMLYIFKKQKSLWVTILMHLIKNTVAFVGLFVIK